MYVYICVRVGLCLHCENYTVSLEYHVALSPQSQCKGVGPFFLGGGGFALVK